MGNSLGAAVTHNQNGVSQTDRRSTGLRRQRIAGSRQFGRSTGHSGRMFVGRRSSGLMRFRAMPGDVGLFAGVTLVVLAEEVKGYERCRRSHGAVDCR